MAGGAIFIPITVAGYALYQALGHEDVSGDWSDAACKGLADAGLSPQRRLSIQDFKRV